MIDDEYRIHWLLNNISVTMRNNKSSNHASGGYPVGFVNNGENSKSNNKVDHYLHNHLRMTIRYIEEPKHFQGARIVGFEVVPFSLKVCISVHALFVRIYNNFYVYITYII